MHDMLNEAALLEQAVLNMMSLLGKKCGGTRTVAVCCSIYRLFVSLIKAPVREWDAAIGMKGDSALRGNRPLIETAKRHARIEAAALVGKKCAFLLWDVAKFSDTVDVRKLIESAIKTNFPTE